jgi:hypothetical protein
VIPASGKGPQLPTSGRCKPRDMSVTRQANVGHSRRILLRLATLQYPTALGRTE